MRAVNRRLLVIIGSGSNLNTPSPFQPKGVRVGDRDTINEIHTVSGQNVS